MTDHHDNEPAAGLAIIQAIRSTWPKSPYRDIEHARVFQTAVMGIPSRIVEDAMQALPRRKVPRESGIQPEEFYTLCVELMAQQRNHSPATPVHARAAVITDPKELTWRAVQSAYQKWISAHQTAPSVDNNGLLIEAEDIERIAQVIDAPTEDTIESHRIAFGKLRKFFEECCGELDRQPGRTSHPYCGCSQCVREIEVFGSEAA